MKTNADNCWTARMREISQPAPPDYPKGWINEKEKNNGK